ncbi:MAG: shikimate dehydrogenase [Actinomycetota bacterium]|nr:shikimate dehydrogenase [Actinomycetota bacterium]
MLLTGETRLVGVIGHPIAHSLSPRMHNASFAATGLDYAYVPLDVHPEALPAAVAGLGALGFRGFNVTMPHKEAIISLLDEVDAAAKLVGAVNTVVVEGGRLLGTNTDGPGFLEACRESGVVFGGAGVLVVGAGGAAAAISAAVLGAGARHLRLLNRSAWRAEGLRRRLEQAYPRAEVSVHRAGEAQVASRGVDVVVNATYLGMKDADPPPLPRDCLGEGMSVCDAVYRRGKETEFVRLAKERGLATVSGERMLLYQGVHAQRLWTGRDPDVRAMSRALA